VKELRLRPNRVGRDCGSLARLPLFEELLYISSRVALEVENCVLRHCLVDRAEQLVEVGDVAKRDRFAVSETELFSHRVELSQVIQRTGLARMRR
jgi:hypothetical protein